MLPNKLMIPTAIEIKAFDNQWVFLHRQNKRFIRMITSITIEFKVKQLAYFASKLLHSQADRPPHGVEVVVHYLSPAYRDCTTVLNYS